MKTKNAYPSRNEGQGALLERTDPVVYCDGESATGPLSREQLDQYERDGFLLCEDVLGADEIAAFRTEAEALLERDKADAGSGEVHTLHDAASISQAFFLLSRNDQIVSIVKQILDDDVYVYQSKVNRRPGFSPAARIWRSDFETWHVEDGMPHMRAMACIIALTDSDVFNGALALAPGSHKRFVSCGEDGPDPQCLRALIDENGLAAPKAKAGSALLLDCNLLYGFTANMSPTANENVRFVYNSVSNRLVAPFSGEAPRGDHLANREAAPITPIEVVKSYATMPLE